MQLDDAYHMAVIAYGFSPRPYACAAHVSRGGSWPHLSIGFGHSGPDVQPGSSVSITEASALLADELRAALRLITERLAASRVGAKENHINALVSLVYGAGFDAIDRAGIFDLIDAGDIGKWPLGPGEHASGLVAAWFGLDTPADAAQPSPALAALRTREIELFFTGRWAAPRSSATRALDPQEPDEPEQIGEGARGDYVEDLHEALAQAGFPVTCGDAFTWCTRDALVGFQEQHGLPKTGVYDAATAAKLGAVLAAAGFVGEAGAGGA